MNNYTLLKSSEVEKKTSILGAIKTLLPLMRKDKKTLVTAFIAGLMNSFLTLLAPLVIAHIIDTYIQKGDFHGVLVFSGFLLALYIGAVVANYFQTLLMGTVGQNLLFTLRNAVFSKLQALPLAFFNQNKSGDLISRINNDTDKLNQFFSQSLMQFISGIITIVGASIFVISINWRVGLAILAPAFIIIVFTWFISPWIKRRNAISLRSVGGMSAGIQENLENFKVVVAFNRRDYFREKFDEINTINYKAATSAGIANNTLTPAFNLASNIAQLIVIAFGLSLITGGLFTLGTLIGFLTYVALLYRPLQQMATVWSNFQLALAGWDRIHAILLLESDVQIVTGIARTPTLSDIIMEFKNVSFGYPDGKKVLQDVNFTLERGKVYALVGPTGGGKTTTASLMARLYDPTEGEIILGGKDIRSLSTAERTKKIGFILQDPFMFTGTVKDNIIYGNEEYEEYSNAELEQVIKDAGLKDLFKRFDQGLETKVTATGGALSLGQKQLVAFIRAMLRKPELLILDEATANIDTVTEKLLEEVLEKLPQSTTRIVIAHRLNTIENADEIFFVNSGTITEAGSMEHAVDMLLHENSIS